MNWVLVGIVIYAVSFLGIIIGTIIYYFRNPQRMSINIHNPNPKVERFMQKALTLFAYLVIAGVAFNIIWGIITIVWIIIDRAVL
jgi:hypothetical protein